MKNTFKILTVVAGLALIASLATKSLKAQTVAPLVVAPARQSLSADPGKNQGFAVRFYNTGVDPITGTFKVADFIVSDNLGTPSFLEGPTFLSDRFAASKWVTLSTNIGTIPGAGMVSINGTINVPKDARPGGKYFAVFFEPDTAVPSASGTQLQEAASVTMRLAGLVYLRVNGPITENASIIKFSAPGFSEYGPVNITTEIKNDGDYHITPKGSITVKNMFGKKVAQTDLEETNVFPDASRIIVSTLGTKWMVGRFTADFAAAYGDAGKSLTSSLAFWVFPWRLALVITLGIIIIILSVVLITNRTGKKQKKLEEELVEEKEELEKLKETLKDKISEVTSEPPLNQEKK